MSVAGFLARVVGLGVVGFIVGVIVGILTWPTVLGVRVPADMAVPHLKLAGIGGAITFVAIGLLIFAGLRAQKTSPSPMNRHPLGMPLSTAPQATSSKSYDVARWNTLVEYDPDLREARNRLAAHGNAYVELLAKEFLSLNDKQYLSAMVSRIEAQALADLDEKNAMPVRNGKYLGLPWWEYRDGVVVASFADADHTFPTMQDFMAAATAAAKGPRTP